MKFSAVAALIGAANTFKMDLEHKEQNYLQELFQFGTNIDTSNDTQLLGTIYAGQQQTPMTVVLDTGSAWTWIAHKDCGTCK